MADSPVEIRGERPGDARAIGVVHDRAFGQATESALVDALRAASRVVVSLVAEAEARVVGHILFTPVAIGSAVEKTPLVLGLGPMAVLPACQRRGIGSRLVAAGLEECRRLGHPAVVVLGHPGYYPRFGFVPASRYGLSSEYVVPDEVFMAMELTEGALRDRGGLVTYAPEFAAFSTD
ncbi:MAG: GNAT family N-acetyltransferase [Candidatus Rokuibacteriota bacterium]